MPLGHRSGKVEELVVVWLDRMVAVAEFLETGARGVSLLAVVVLMVKLPAIPRLVASLVMAKILSLQATIQEVAAKKTTAAAAADEEAMAEISLNLLL